jgi:hypothetical protein
MQIQTLKSQLELKSKLRYLKSSLNEMPETLFVRTMLFQLGFVGNVFGIFADYSYSKYPIISYCIQHPSSREFRALSSLLTDVSNDLLLKSCFSDDEYNFECALLAGADVNSREPKDLVTLYINRILDDLW